MWQIVADKNQIQGTALPIDAQRLNDILSVRWYFLVLHLIVLFLGSYISWDVPSFASLFPATAILLTTNLWGFSRLKDHSQFHIYEIIFHLIIDALCLFYLVFLTGGSHNPFAILFLITVILAAQCLPLKWTWTFSFFLCSLYILLFVADSLHVDAHHAEHLSSQFNLHIIGMIISFIFLCFFITHYVAKTTHKLQSKERELQENDQLILIGAFAAQAAHQMGSPLSSLSVISKQISSHIAPTYSKLLDNEVLRCQSILRELADKTAFKKAHSGGKANLFKFVENTVSSWSTRNQLKVQTHISPGLNSPNMILDKTFEYAIYNILDNSKEAGAENIICQIENKGTRYRIMFIDDGKGLELDSKHYLSLHPRQRHSQGMGLGIYLTSMTVKSLKGTLDMFNNSLVDSTKKGVCVVITFGEKS